jgi:hypothetical protein
MKRREGNVSIRETEKIKKRQCLSDGNGKEKLYDRIGRKGKEYGKVVERTRMLQGDIKKNPQGRAGWGWG